MALCAGAWHHTRSRHVDGPFGWTSGWEASSQRAACAEGFVLQVLIVFNSMRTSQVAAALAETTGSLRPLLKAVGGLLMRTTPAPPSPSDRSDGATSSRAAAPGMGYRLAKLQSAFSEDCASPPVEQGGVGGYEAVAMGATATAIACASELTRAPSRWCDAVKQLHSSPVGAQLSLCWDRALLTEGLSNWTVELGTCALGRFCSTRAPPYASPRTAHPHLLVLCRPPTPTRAALLPPDQSPLGSLGPCAQLFHVAVLVPIPNRASSGV